MGTKAEEIVGLDVNELISELNKAYADEWLAFYQYWVTAQVAQGRESKMVAEELKRVALEELEHAEEMAARIIQLGGRPLTNPKEWFTKTNCVYKEPPKDPQEHCPDSQGHHRGRAVCHHSLQQAGDDGSRQESCHLSSSNTHPQ